MSHLRLELTQQHRLEQSLEISGGATSSIFVSVERLLQNTEYQKALEYVASRKKMDVYWSMIDFLFCELFSEWRLSCRRYYAGNGPQLRFQISAEDIIAYDLKMVIAMEVAYKLFCEQRCRSWVQYKHEVRQALAA